MYPVKDLIMKKPQAGSLSDNAIQSPVTSFIHHVTNNIAVFLLDSFFFKFFAV